MQNNEYVIAGGLIVAVVIMAALIFWDMYEDYKND